MDILPGDGLEQAVPMETDTDSACRLQGHQHNDTGSIESEDEWEETLVFVDLNDIPNVEELFAAPPNDFLGGHGRTKKSRTNHPETLPKKSRTKINLKFYNLDEVNPFLQIGDRFYMGTYEEPMGSLLYFREKEVNDNNQSSGSGQLHSIVPEMDPPSHPVFGEHRNCTKEYELVANVHKILKMTRGNVNIENECAESDQVKQVPSTIDISVPSVAGTSTSDKVRQPAKDLTSNLVTHRNTDLTQGVATSQRYRRRNEVYRKGVDANVADED